MNAIAQITEPSRSHLAPGLLDSGVRVRLGGGCASDGNPVLASLVVEGNVDFGVCF